MKREFIIIILAFLGLEINGMIVKDKLPIVNQLNKASKTYIIKTDLDLHGDTLRIPQNCKLKIRGGSISNGTIVGDGTKLQVKGCHVLKNVVITGTWCVGNIYDKWFDFEGDNDTQILKSLFALCDKDTHNCVYLDEQEIQIDGYDKDTGEPSVIKIASNTDVLCKSKIMILPSSNNQSFPLYFRDVDNCSWNGGHIVGDLETHIGNEGEQGFGFALRGAHNITIKNVRIEDCWGDGINLQYSSGRHNENITIENVICNRNRRQGISIEDGLNIIIRRCYLINTGVYRGTAPMFGIDIEPIYESAYVKNVLIEDCVFEGNNAGSFTSYNLKSNSGNITINNCKSDGVLQFSKCEFDGQNGIVVNNYESSGKLRFGKYVRNISINGSSFTSLMSIDNDVRLEDVIIRNSSFITDEKRTWNYYACALICQETNNVVFDSCTFEVLEGCELTNIFPTGGDWNGVLIKNSSIKDNRKKSIVVPCNTENCNFICDNTLTLMNCTKGEMSFTDNKIILRNQGESSVYTFFSSDVPKYRIENIEIESSNPTNLYSRHKSNKGSATVSSKQTNKEDNKTYKGITLEYR